MERKLSQDLLMNYEGELNLYWKVLQQKRTDKDKIYSLHKTFTSCIVKGKAHKKYEFGTKVGLIATYNSLIINAIKSFDGNPYDSKTIEPLLDQIASTIDYTPEEVIYDRGGKGQNQIKNTKISTPDYRPLKRDTAYQKRVKLNKFRRRAALNPLLVI